MWYNDTNYKYHKHHPNTRPSVIFTQLVRQKFERALSITSSCHSLSLIGWPSLEKQWSMSWTAHNPQSFHCSFLSFLVPGFSLTTELWVEFEMLGEVSNKWKTIIFNIEINFTHGKIMLPRAMCVLLYKEWWVLAIWNACSAANESQTNTSTRINTQTHAQAHTHTHTLNQSLLVKYVF